MKLCILVSAFCLLTSVVFAGLSGIYTIKSDGTGDFPTLMDAGESLSVLGMSGDCVFELYGDTLGGAFGAGPVAGSDSLTTVFRPGPGEDPVVWGEEFISGGYHNVKIESLRLSYVPITAEHCSGWRISGCRFFTHNWGVTFEYCASETLDGNTFEVLPEGSGHDPAVILTHSSDCVVLNNMINSHSNGVDRSLVVIERSPNLRVLFNTIRESPADVEGGTCVEIWGTSPCEVRNNVFVLAIPADTLNACVDVVSTLMDSIVLDNNCYFVESLGWVGMRDSNPPARYDWVAWRGFGFEANGINADPMLISATNLHLRQGSPCIGAAAPLPGIEFDIDGDPRDPTHPDIGADEFTGGGIEEGMTDEGGRMNNGPTILSGAKVHSLASKVVFDALGRRALNPTPGVYFVREQSVVSSQHSGTEHGARNTVHVRKVVIQR